MQNKDCGLVSIIVPVYKSERYLHRCVDSILTQSYRNIEIILIDDGSPYPDKSSQICDEYSKKDSRVRTVHQDNSGVSFARNVGLDIADGSYICFVDSDDYLHKDFVKNNIACMKQYNADIVCCNASNIINDEISVNRKYSSNMTTMDIINGIYKGELPGCVWDKVYKADIWSNVRFPVSQNIAEDVYVTAHLLYNSNVIVANEESLYYYNKDNDVSLTHIQPKNTYLQKFYGVLERAKVAKGLWNDLYIYSMNECFKYAFKCYQYDIVFKFLSDAEKSILNSFFVSNGSFYKYLDLERKIYIYSYLYFKWFHYLKGLEYFLKFRFRK